MADRLSRKDRERAFERAIPPHTQVDLPEVPPPDWHPADWSIRRLAQAIREEDVVALHTLDLLTAPQRREVLARMEARCNAIEARAVDAGRELRQEARRREIDKLATMLSGGAR